MKDIVEACEISRGGLYLYFGSTAEIFLEVCGSPAVFAVKFPVLHTCLYQLFHDFDRGIKLPF